MLKTWLGAVLGSLLLVATTAGTPAESQPVAGGRLVAAPHPPAEGRANVVVVVMDDMRRDDLPWMPTVVDQIGKRGTRYRHYYTPVALCCPARASLLRGQYPHNTGILTNAEPDGGYAGFRRLDSSTLATWLDPFYKTAYVGKYFNGYEGPGQRYVPPGWDDWQGTISTYGYRTTVTNDNGIAVDNKGTNSPEVFGDQSARFIKGQADAKQPFFLHLSFVNPHNGGPHNDGDGGKGSKTPFVQRRDRGTYEGPLHAQHDGYNEKNVRDKTGPVADLPRLSRRERDHIVLANQQRRESLASADRAVDRVMTSLRRNGELDNTYVIFTSDNGYLLGEHRFPRGKTQPYEESSHLPLLIRGPGVPDRSWDGVATTPDLARTVLDMADLSAARVAPNVTLDGQSILHTPTRLKAARRRGVLLEGARLPVDAENQGAVRYAAPRRVADTDFYYRAVVTRRWKLIEWYPFDDSLRGWELYDLRTDRHETESVLGDRGTRPRVRALKDRLEQLWRCAGRQCR